MKNSPHLEANTSESPTRSGALSSLEGEAKRALSFGVGLLKLIEDLQVANLRPESEEALWSLIHSRNRF